MPERSVRVGSSVGLHARPAALFTQAAAKAPVPVTIAKAGGAPVDARSILLVLTLGVGHGDEVVLRAEGDGADEALDQLAELLATDLDAAPTGR
jgi:phosphocarrier protein HPr